MSRNYLLVPCFIYGLCILINEVNSNANDADESSPPWAAFESCQQIWNESSCPQFTICHFGNTFESKTIIDEIKSIHISCSTTHANEELDCSNMTAILILAESMAFLGENLDDSHNNENFLKLVSRFDVEETPSFIVLVLKEGFQIYEWYSPKLNEIAISPITNNRLAEHFENITKDFDTEVYLLAKEMMCDTIEHLFNDSSAFHESSLLWIIFAVILIVGLFLFGCWIYRFTKNHPTDDTNESYEMTQAYYEEGEIKATSNFLVSQSDNIEAASPDPAKSNTIESLNNI